jgi:hypothetical protein
MSTITPVNTFPFQTSQDVAITTWSGVAAGDTCEPIRLGVWSDRTVQVGGTFGGATIRIQGSNDDIEYFTLTDPQGNPLSFVAAGLEAIIELPAFLRPSIEGGDGTSSVKVIISGRRSI